MTRDGVGKAKPWLGRLAFVADRTLVLFMGVGVGAAIALAFVGGGSVRLDRTVAATPAPPPAPAGPRAAQAPRPSPSGASGTALECPATLSAHLTKALAAGEPVTIGVFGDSFGDGVWAALYRRMARENVRVLRLSQEGTGFTRYQVINLEQKAAEQLKAQPVDIAVIVTGANDVEGLWDDAHAHAYALMSPGWKTIYGARITRFVRLIRGQGAMVYWVGLPKMRQARYDADVAALDDFYSSRMAALGVPFLPTREISADSAGAFNLYLEDPVTKAPRLMRANDGIHMTPAGYERLAGPLMDRIHAYLAKARADTPVPAPPAPAPAAPRP